MTHRRKNLLGRAHRDERGATLLEVMIGATIMGVAFVGLMSMLWTLMATTMTHRQSVRAGLLVTEVAESLEGATYVSCGTPASYSGSLSSGAGYVATIESVEYLADSTTATQTFVTSCPSPDQGLQRITIKAVFDTDISGSGTVNRTEYVEHTLRDTTCPTYYPIALGDAC